MRKADRLFTRVLVVLGDGPAARAAARLAVHLAAASGGQVRGCYVVERGEVYRLGAPGALRERVRDDVVRHGERALGRLDALCRAAKVISQGRLLHGDVGAEVAHEARRFRAQVIVMATVGRGRVGTFLLGSRAQEVVSRAPCPVLLVPLRARAAARRGRAGG